MSFARVVVDIAAPRETVWNALLTPETLKKIMPVEEVLAPWRLGERFAWRFELAGKPSHVEGLVHRLEAPRLLEYEFVDPHSRDVLKQHHVHRVVIELSEEAGGTRLSLTQDENRTDAAWRHAEGGWRFALGLFKRLVEG
ncbi:MAG TPA: SRPBCC domain-containing protein [Archangium sp.]